MCIDKEKCGCWISLHSLGIKSEGCIRDTQWLRSIKVPCSQSLINNKIYANHNNIQLSFIKNVAHGSFGSIDLASFTDRFGIKKDVYVKKPIIQGKSLLYEACIQKLVCDHLELIGFPTGAPKVIAIFALLDGSICFAMEQIENATTMSALLGECSENDITEIIIDCLLQITAILWYLESELGINHRDLKPSNFLVCSHTPENKTLFIGDDIIDIHSKYTITFIDFGFSCMGSIETQKPDISLSSVYSHKDPCPKNGRDMYMFIAFLFMEFHSKIKGDILDLFYKWLEIPGVNMPSFLKKYGIRAKQWVYFYSGNSNIKEFVSCPQNIIKDLANLIIKDK